jgi:GYF domain 2
MSDRSWFYASNGQQQGPYPEAQLRDLIARGAIRTDTLVWSEGMSGWQKAGEIPGLMSGGSRPPAMPTAGAPPMGTAGGYSGVQSARPLSFDFEILEFVWRTLVMVVGMIFVIPAPWVLVWYMKWLIPQISVPSRPNLGFDGNAMTIVPWFFGLVVLEIIVAFLGLPLLGNLMYLVQIALYWLFLKWFIANLSSNGQPIGLSFTGGFWPYLGWTLLTILAFITIIGWAWVYVAQLRWFYRNIEGTRREIIFTGTGLEFLWRSVVAVIACVFIIPIPWMYRWFGQWMASQTILAPRGTAANG